MANDLENRMKSYEKLNANRLMPRLPILVRLDGRAFHTYTKGLERPFSVRLHSCMVQTALHLSKEFHAAAVYTQSDEITLLFYTDNPLSEALFGGKSDKINSILAATASCVFNTWATKVLTEKQGLLPVFDGRCWNVPTKEEAANVFIWREQDAVRNSILAAAQAKYSHKFLQGKKTNELQDLLFVEHGINWNNYPPAQKRGTYILPVTEKKVLTSDIIAKMRPEQREAYLEVGYTTRKVRQPVSLPILTKVANRVEVLFYGHTPITFDELGAKSSRVHQAR